MGEILEEIDPGIRMNIIHGDGFIVDICKKFFV
jgi:hypothetical protein